MKKTLLKQLSSRKALFTAWKTVYASASQSQALEIRSEAENFSADLIVNIEKLQRRLSRGNFSFSPIKGVLQRKQNKKNRPIGIAKIEDRIVQRAILEELLKIKPLWKEVNNPNSFGGNKEGGVQNAIHKLVAETKNGATFFAKTDIKNFFGSIPHPNALEALYRFLPDDSLKQLLESALVCELSNASSPEIQEHIDMFPKDQVGMIQGCCLSPLFGNLLLSQFDQDINSKNVTCMRYIDDYIIVGAERQVREAFTQSIKILNQLSLEVYKLNDDKAGCGLLRNGVDFLGCYIHPGFIRPSTKSKNKLLAGINSRMEESLQLMRSKDKKYEAKKHSLCAVLGYVRFKVKGWSDAYRFCTDKSFFMHTEEKILLAIENYLSKARSIINNQQTNQKKALLFGVQLLPY